MKNGGLAVSTRLQLIKSGVHDLTTLMPNNNTVDIEDLSDGSYLVKVTLIKITATVKVFVNMDKNIPANGGELPPVQLTFEPPPEATEEAAPTNEESAETEQEPVEPTAKNGKLRAAGNELMSMLGVGQEGMKAKSAIAVAADAFADAGQEAGRKRDGKKVTI